MNGMSMKWLLGVLLWGAFLALSGCVAFPPSEPVGNLVALANSGTTVTFIVKDSQGQPLGGVQIWGLGIPPSTGTWYKLGVTGSDGTLTVALPPNRTYTFEAQYNKTKSQVSQYVGTEPVIVNFQTIKVTVQLVTCQGQGLQGGNVRYRGDIDAGTWQTFGTTGPDGAVSKELFPGNFPFSVEYRQTYTDKWQNVASNSMVKFVTTKVTLYHTGSIQYYGNPSAGTLYPFSQGMEMLPGTIRFLFGGIGVIPIDINGCEYKAALVVVELKDSAGSPLSGAKVMRKGGPISPGTWFIFGTTDTNGRVFGLLAPGYTYSFEVQYNMTSAQQSGYVPTTLEYSFQTKRVTVKLETCAGIGLAGGNVRYRGSVSSGTWFTFGKTGADGTVSKELFPGNWWFGVEYRQTYAEKQQDVGTYPEVLFTTTKVWSSFTGKIEYKGNPSSGTWFTFTNPMEMLPGTITFRFNGTTTRTFTISGCQFEIGLE